MIQSDNRTADLSAKAIREQFVGTWKLVSIDSPESRLFGGSPVGVLMYDAGGNVAVQIMRSPRPDLAGGPAFPPAKEVQAAYKGYYAYYGTWEVDEQRGIIKHHLEGSLRPGDVGKDFVRAYKFTGNQLALTPVEDLGASNSCLTWERAK
jgi:Lipocalin-like domain